MKTRTGRPRGLTRQARALGLDRNPLRRVTDRAEAWIRVGLLTVFLIAGPMAALGTGHWGDSSRGRHPGRGDPRVIGPVSRVKGGHRTGDQEDGEQPDPDPGLGPVGGPAQWIAVQPERTSQPREATRPASPGFHGLTIAQPSMQEVASTQSSTSDVLTDLNKTNSPSLAVPIPLHQK